MPWDDGRCDLIQGSYIVPNNHKMGVLKMRLFLALPTVSFVLIITGNLYAQSEDEGQSRRGRGFDIMRFDENKDG